jgi:ribosomal-protein-alanine N-acetyltransferase
MKSALECRILRPEHVGALKSFFHRIVSAGVDKYFHPHPFTHEEAERISSYAAKDLYYALLLEGDVVAYGMLRGWDQGYDVPALGITVDPNMQMRGFGRLLMHFLHMAARQHNARQIRLKVYPDNVKAIALYESLGYRFNEREDGQMIGLLNL